MNFKILCVDDEPNVLETYQRALGREFAIETALGGEQGLARIASQGPFAVILSDLRMPGMDGIQFLVKVKDLAPDSVRILLTGQADQHTAVEAVNEGNIFRFLTKPCPLEVLAKALTAGLQQYRLVEAEKELVETLRDQATRDPLTMLFNRRYMEESLERELLRAGRKQRPLGIIMLDLDHFKRFNDTFGHEAGDTLLREFANFLRTQVRREDIVCRYGGEEFTLIFPEASLDDAYKRAEQLREAVQHLHVEHHSQSLCGVTVSVGVAAFPEHGSSADALLRVADAALYRAKAAGRDRVVKGQLLK